jgi:3-hydroxyacyl-CoA dehydrogenase/enoyl-CoA hydratase/3-hydroxybutyryl-CoA epimerase
MVSALPLLTEFRIEERANGLIHLVFDCPDRSMNVFSNKAIHQLGAFADWLRDSDVRGVVVRSGKTSGFCAGADLTELGQAYDMIVAAPPARRFDLAYDHFFPLSHAIRRLETAGKPIAAAIAGVALGGGCELALGCHYRVVTDSKRAMLGLPECAVGLLPGAGGTQRMPRLVGLELGLEVLLQGRNLLAKEALAAGLTHAVVTEGEEVAAAEAWLLSDAAHRTQPWDRPGALPVSHSASAEHLAAVRKRELARMLGHEPAPLAILDCVELGLMQPMDGAIRSEMAVFARLIQRPEPRNMIRTMFLGKQAWDKAARVDAVPGEVLNAKASIAARVHQAADDCPELRSAGLLAGSAIKPVQEGVGEDFWFKSVPEVNAAILGILADCTAITRGLDAAKLLLLDHALALEGIIPAYLGGLSGLAAAAQRAR